MRSVRNTSWRAPGAMGSVPGGVIRFRSASCPPSLHRPSAALPAPSNEDGGWRVEWEDRMEGCFVTVACSMPELLAPDVRLPIGTRWHRGIDRRGRHWGEGRNGTDGIGTGPGMGTAFRGDETTRAASRDRMGGTAGCARTGENVRRDTPSFRSSRARRRGDEDPLRRRFSLSMMKASDRGERGSPESLASSPTLPVRLVRPSPAITTGRTRCSTRHHGSA